MAPGRPESVTTRCGPARPSSVRVQAKRLHFPNIGAVAGAHSSMPSIWCVRAPTLAVSWVRAGISFLLRFWLLDDRNITPYSSTSAMP